MTGKGLRLFQNGRHVDSEMATAITSNSATHLEKEGTGR